MVKLEKELLKDDKVQKLVGILSGAKPWTIACSGGLDSLTLSILSHRFFPKKTIIAHALSPAVPKEATTRVKRYAKTEKWRLWLIDAEEFKDETYLSNPYNRCYFCKSHLYAAIARVKPGPVFSGANTDDLGEYRPGLDAARERGVRHPLIEAGIAKEDIRRIARLLKLSFSELPASPCLSSRFYTGTRLTAEWLRAVDRAETDLKENAGFKVVRCRVQGRRILVEVPDDERSRWTEAAARRLKTIFKPLSHEIEDIALDPRPYRPGRAFVPAL